MIKRKATVFGYHGMKNFGDDFFLEFILDFLKKKNFDKAVVIAKKGSLGRLKENQGLEVIEGVTSRIKLRGYEKWGALLHHSITSEYLIFCAGSIFTILPERLFNFLVRFLRFVRPRVKIIAIGVSIGPFRSLKAENLVVSAIASFDQIAVRDKKSMLFVGSHPHAVFMRDLAFSCLPDEIIDKEDGSLGLCLNPYASILSPKKMSDEIDRNDLFVSEIFNAFTVGAVRSVTLFTTCSNPVYGDRQLADDIFLKLTRLKVPVKQVVYEGCIAEFRYELSKCEKVIASRLHAGFFSLLGRANVLQLKYAEKVSEFYGGLDLQGIVFLDAYDIPSDKLKRFLTGSYQIFPKDEQVLKATADDAARNLEKLLDGV